MFLIISMGCLRKNSTNESTSSESIANSQKHTADINIFNRPLPLHKNESNGVRLVLTQSNYSISKRDTLKYEIHNLDNYRVDAGESHELEFWEENKWNDVPFDKSVAQVLYMIWKDSYRSFDFNLLKIESSFLIPGKYRIINIVEVYKEEKTKKKRITLFAEFVLVE